MPRWFKATCLKEIYWQGKTYSQHDKISVTEDDVRILSAAGVIGDVKKIEVAANTIEMAVRKAPENEAIPYRRKARGK